MSTPFPGMDPYLERAGMWEEVHTRLIVAMADALGPHGVDATTATSIALPPRTVAIRPNPLWPSLGLSGTTPWPWK